MKHEHIVKSVEVGSIAEEMGIEAGDKLIRINDNVIEDVFDYHYYVNDEEIVVLIEKPDGEEINFLTMTEEEWTDIIMEAYEMFY